MTDDLPSGWEMLKTLCILRVRARALSVFDDAHPDTSIMPCELCGTWGYPRELHHRQFRSRGGGWTPANILLLCPGCHLAATEERAPAGVNVSAFSDPRKVAVKLWYTDKPVCLDNAGGYDPCCPISEVQQ